MPRLRGADAGGRRIGKRVALQYYDPLEIGRNRFCRGKAAHSGADDDGALCYNIGHCNPALVEPVA